MPGPDLAQDPRQAEVVHAVTEEALVLGGQDCVTHDGGMSSVLRIDARLDRKLDERLVVGVVIVPTAGNSNRSNGPRSGKLRRSR